MPITLIREHQQCTARRNEISPQTRRQWTEEPLDETRLNLPRENQESVTSSTGSYLHMTPDLSRKHSYINVRDYIPGLPQLTKNNEESHFYVNQEQARIS